MCSTYARPKPDQIKKKKNLIVPGIRKFALISTLIWARTYSLQPVSTLLPLGKLGSKVSEDGKHLTEISGKASVHLKWSLALF